MTDTTNPLASLNIELSGKDFTPVLIPDSQYVLQVVEARVHTNKNTGRNSLALKLVTTSTIPSTVPGETVEAGKDMQLFTALQPKTNDGDEGHEANVQNTMARLCRVVDAVFACNPQDRPNLNMDTINQMVGKQVIGYVGIEDDPVYGKQNRIQTIVALTE